MTVLVVVIVVVTVAAAAAAAAAAVAVVVVVVSGGIYGKWRQEALSNQPPAPLLSSATFLCQSIVFTWQSVKESPPLFEGGIPMPKKCTCAIASVVFQSVCVFQIRPQHPPPQYPIFLGKRRVRLMCGTRPASTRPCPVVAVIAAGLGSIHIRSIPVSSRALEKWGKWGK